MELKRLVVLGGTFALWMFSVTARAGDLVDGLNPIFQVQLSFGSGSALKSNVRTDLAFGVQRTRAFHLNESASGPVLPIFQASMHGLSLLEAGTFGRNLLNPSDRFLALDGGAAGTHTWVWWAAGAAAAGAVLAGGGGGGGGGATGEAGPPQKTCTIVHTDPVAPGGEDCIP